ncbi:MAG: lipid-binding SYLF domain-containing protein [Alphaproteobacteria bacterium]|nr:lipid-binding SYLF domain-containing protein [Alphaproteobacteria bacterium]
MLKRFFLITLSLLFLSQNLMASRDQQELVDRSKIVFQSLMNDQGYKNNLESLLERAKGVIIIPSLFKAGFILGGEGGNGLVITKTQNGDWSYPAFVTFAGGSIGLQIGFESSEVLLVIMTDNGLRNVMNDSFTLGAEASIAAGPVGAGLSAQMTANFDADIYTYCHSKGLFGGGSLKGSVIKARHSWNEAYYNADNITAEQILLLGRYKNPDAEPLRAALKAGTIYTPPVVSPPLTKTYYNPQRNAPNYQPSTQSSTQNNTGNLKPQDRIGFNNRAQPKSQQIDVEENTGPKELLPWQRG